MKEAHMDSNEKRELWEAGQQKARCLLAGAEKYIGGLKNLTAALAPTDGKLRCIDEGTPGGVHMAGSGILQRKETALDNARKAGVTGVFSHEECGAAAAYARMADREEEADQLARGWAMSLAEELGVPYEGHIGAADLKRPAGIHVARVAYVAGPKNFDATRVPELPTGFHINAGVIGTYLARNEAIVARDIALGPHGFGELFTAKDPFIFVPVGDPDNPEFSADKLSELLAPVASAGKGRAVIRGFTAPKK